MPLGLECFNGFRALKLNVLLKSRTIGFSASQRSRLRFLTSR